ncbi:MAG: peptide chain release factor 2, partial [Nitrospirae bacterium CG_4_8_14_3_um_filter_70_85]
EEEGFWNDLSRAQEVQKERAHLVRVVAGWERHASAFDDLDVLFEFAAAEPEEREHEVEIGRELDRLEEELNGLEISTLLSGETDANHAIVEINPGAGGTESQDWAQMLLRMYTHWAERRGFSHKLLDYLPGEEAGIKSATLLIEGEYAFGSLRGETGVHRLVRISPFDSAKRRHTSFSSVFVSPELDDEIVVEVEEKDLRIDTYRSSGAGGQHVNKTSSAIRITHIPTNTVVCCQNERSQHKNRSTAMKMLKAKLYELERRAKEAEQAVTNAEKKDISWGNQIRSYVLAPYQMVKDLRTRYEMSNVEAVLDGDLDGFIKAYLLTGR